MLLDSSKGTKLGARATRQQIGLIAIGFESVKRTGALSTALFTVLP